MNDSGMLCRREKKEKHALLILSINVSILPVPGEVTHREVSSRTCRTASSAVLGTEDPDDGG